MARRADRINVEWETPPSLAWTWEHIQLEVLMDIRQELRRLNELLHCSNFVGIPRTLRGIQRKLPTPRKVKR